MVAGEVTGRQNQRQRDILVPVPTPFLASLWARLMLGGDSPLSTRTAKLNQNVGLIAHHENALLQDRLLSETADRGTGAPGVHPLL